MDTICETMMDLTWNVDLPRPSSQRLSAKKDCISWAPSLKPVSVCLIKQKNTEIKIKRLPYSHLCCLLTAVHVWRPCKKCSIIKSSREVLPVRTRIDSTDSGQKQCCEPGFNGVPGSGSRRAKMTHKNRGKSINFIILSKMTHNNRGKSINFIF